MPETFKVYVNQIYRGDLYSIIDLSHFIAATPPNENLYVTDISDTKVLSTIGNFLDHVPNKDLLRSLHSILIPLQMGIKETKDVKLNFVNNINI